MSQPSAPPPVPLQPSAPPQAPLQPALAALPQDPLTSFLQRLSHIVEKHDLNQYKNDHSSTETTQKVLRLKKILSNSPYISHQFTDPQLVHVLFTKFAAKDVHKAYTLLVFLCLSNDNQLLSNDLHYKHSHSQHTLSGIDNWNSVLCYFDSLMFAMFARVDHYDCSVLVSDPAKDSGLVTEFKLCLRLVVNLMRSGEAVVTTDLIQVVCSVFAALGFSEAVSNRQQDVVSCFETMCDYLRVPLLTLKIDIIHSGKVDLDDDLKYMSERVLFLSMPEEQINDLKNQPIQEEEDGVQSSKNFFSKRMMNKLSKKEKDDMINLEECLNSYFNNSVKVKRVLERRRTLTQDAVPQRSLTSSASIFPLASPQPSNNTFQDQVSLSTNDMDDDFSVVDLDLLSDLDLKERNEFLGIVSYSSEVLEPVLEPVPVEGMRMSSLLNSSPARASYLSVSSLQRRSTDNTSPFSPGSEEDHLRSATSNGSENSRATSLGKELLMRSASSPVAISPMPTRHRRRDSMSKINEIITRTRSSTDLSARSNPMIKRTNSTTLAHTPNGELEVTLPAWMFLQLLPYYSDFGEDDADDLKKNSGRPRMMSDDKASVEFVEDLGPMDLGTQSPAALGGAFDARLAHQLQNPIRKLYLTKRPLVPICLKRYIYNESGKTQKINKKFTIPPVIDLPYFVADDRATDINNESTNKSFDRFRLVLESVVCHRGNSVDSGHYVAASRKTPYVLTKLKKSKEDDLVWLLFNDMNSADDKITEKSFKQILDSESPYLLFYRIEDHEFDSLESSNSSLTKTDTLDAGSSSTLFKDKLLLEKLSSTADFKDLRKNSIISTLSQVSSLKKDDEIRQVNSVSSATPSVSTQSTAVQQTPASLLPAPPKLAELVPQLEEKNGRHSHHFSFTRSLSRSGSRPPAHKKDTFAPPESIDYVDFGDKFYWYYENEDGSFCKQNKNDDSRHSFPFHNVLQQYRSEHATSETSELTKTQSLVSKDSLLTVDVGKVEKAAEDSAEKSAEHSADKSTVDSGLAPAIVISPISSTAGPSTLKSNGTKSNGAKTPTETKILTETKSPKFKSSKHGKSKFNKRLHSHGKSEEKSKAHGKSTGKSADDKCVIV